MDARTKIKYKRIVGHLKVCLQAQKHGRWYWENGEVLRYQIDFGPPLTERQLADRIERQRSMLKRFNP